jgi:formylglycine-generating enzyme required for sulfatase activity
MEKAERALNAKDIFKECTYCPEMVVVPSGEFMASSNHKVTIVNAFAVSRFEVTFDDYDTCVEFRGCEYRLFDRDWGRGSQPVINIDWYEAKNYVAWLSKWTGKPYRLLSEAEWEYAARAGSDKKYSWGGEIGIGNANCKGCGSQWDNKRPAPVGSFAPNSFGLYDMVGNVSEWVEDWYSDTDAMRYDDGRPVTSGNWELRVIRGGSWAHSPDQVTLQARFHGQASQRGPFDGFRIARTLLR